MDKTLTREEIIKKINSISRACLNEYYQNRSAENFFKIDDILRVCYKQEFTKDEIPDLIEMQNVILMG